MKRALPFIFLASLLFGGWPSWCTATRIQPLNVLDNLAAISAAQQSLLSWAEIVSLFGMGAGVFLGVFSSGASRLALAMVAGFGAVFAVSTTWKYLDPFMPWIVAGLVLGFFAWLVAHLVHKERNHLTMREEFEGIAAENAALKKTTPLQPLLANLRPIPST